MDTENGRDNSPPEGEKPIIDQMTELAAQAAGTLAETAVKAGAKKAKKAVARRLPGPVKKAATTIARAAKAGAERKPELPKPELPKPELRKPELRKLGLRQKRQSRKPPRSLRRDQQKPVDQGLNVAPSARKRPPEVPRKRPGGGEAPDRQLDCRRMAPPDVPPHLDWAGPSCRGAESEGNCEALAVPDIWCRRRRLSGFATERTTTTSLDFANIIEAHECLDDAVPHSVADNDVGPLEVHQVSR